MRMNELYMAWDDAETERMMAIREIDEEGLIIDRLEMADYEEEYAS